MRYLTTTTCSCVSMWMSEARRWIALKSTESTSLMIGLASAVMRSIERTSWPSSSSRTTCILNSSVASSSTRCVDSDFWRMSWRAALDPTLTLRRFLRSPSSSSRFTTSARSAMTTARDPFSAFSGTNSKRSIHSSGIDRKSSASIRNVQRATYGSSRRSASWRARVSSEAASRNRGIAASGEEARVVLMRIRFYGPSGLDVGEDREHGKVDRQEDHRDDTSHDDEDDRLDEGHDALEPLFDRLVVEIRHVREHLLERTRRLADLDHLYRERRDDAGLLEASPQLGALAHARNHGGDGARDAPVRDGPRRDVERGHERRSGSDERRERAGELRERELLEDRPDERKAQEEAVPGDAPRVARLPAGENDAPHGERRRHDENVRVQEVGRPDHHPRDEGQPARLEAREELPELRDDVRHQDADEPDGQGDEDRRIDEGPRHLAPDPAEDLLVGEIAAQHLFDLARALTGLERGRVEPREDVAVREEGVREGDARDELAADVLQDRLEARILLALEEDVEAVHDGEAGLQERGELLVEDEELPRFHRAAAARHEPRQDAGHRARAAGRARGELAAGELHGEEPRAEARDLGLQRTLVGRFDRARDDRTVTHPDAADVGRHQFGKIPGPGWRKFAKMTTKSLSAADSSRPTPRM